MADHQTELVEVERQLKSLPELVRANAAALVDAQKQVHDLRQREQELSELQVALSRQRTTLRQRIEKAGLAAAKHASAKR